MPRTEIHALDTQLKELRALEIRRETAGQHIRDLVQKMHHKMRFRWMRLEFDLGYSHPVVVFTYSHYVIAAHYNRMGETRSFGLWKTNNQSENRLLYGQGYFGHRTEEYYDRTYAWEIGDSDKVLLDGITEWVESDELQHKRDEILKIKNRLGIGG